MIISQIVLLLLLLVLVLLVLLPGRFSQRNKNGLHLFYRTHLSVQYRLNPNRRDTLCFEGYHPI